MPMKRSVPLFAAFGVVALLACGLASQLRFDTTRSATPTTLTQTPSMPIATTPKPVQRFSMIAVGDIMTDRNVGKVIQTNGVQSILEQVRAFTQDADVTFGNLECPLSTVGPHAPKDCVFRARPQTVQVLLDGGFDVVSLANNHSLNAGREGILQTLNCLDKHKTLYCGASRDRTRAGDPAIIEAGEGPVRVGFIGATDLSFGHGSYNKVSHDRSNLVAQIEAAKTRCDILCVSLHWGDEYQALPNARQRATAHAAIDAGADVILGHHPHTLEGIEVYRGKPILYSMGNFVFDQREGERMESAIFRLEYTRGWGWQICAKPVWISRSRLGPVYPDVARRDRILARLAKISKPLGTTLQIQGGKAWLRVPESTAATEQAE